MAAKGETLDIDRLYRESRTALIGYFTRRHRGAGGVEDLLHETFLRLLRRTGSLRHARSPRAYLFGIARHVSADAFRNAPPAEQEGYGPEDVVAPSPDPVLAAAREILLQLPPLQREILDLRFQHNLSYAEIAEALDVPLGTVRSRLHHAIRMLRDRFADEDASTEKETHHED